MGVKRKELGAAVDEPKVWTASTMGRKGGHKSRRVLTTEDSLNMIKIRERNRKKRERLASAKNKIK